FDRLAAEASGKRVVLFLDQFERSTARFDLQTRAGRDDLAALCKQVLSGPVAVTLVPVIVDDNQLLTTLVQACSMANVGFQIVQCAAFERTEVMNILQTLAHGADIDFDGRIIDEMSLSYEQTKSASPEQRFTLAHVQAVCHILTATRTLD